MSGRQMTLTAKALEELRDHSLADRSDQDDRLAYRFAAATHEQRVQVRILQVLSRHHPVTVIRAIGEATSWRPAASDNP